MRTRTGRKPGFGRVVGALIATLWLAVAVAGAVGGPGAVGVDEVGVVTVLHPLEEVRRPDGTDLVPAHVGHGHRSGEPPDLAGDDGQPPDSAALLAPVEEELETEADPEEGGSRGEGVADPDVPAGGAEVGHRVAEGAHAGKDDPRALTGGDGRGED